MKKIVNKKNETVKESRHVTFHDNPILAAGNNDLYTLCYHNYNFRFVNLKTGQGELYRSTDKQRTIDQALENDYRVFEFECEVEMAQWIVDNYDPE